MRATASSPAPFAAVHGETAFLAERYPVRLDRREPGWCAHLSFIEPHPPLVAPAPFHAAVHPDDLPAPSGLARAGSSIARATSRRSNGSRWCRGRSATRAATASPG